MKYIVLSPTRRHPETPADVNRFLLMQMHEQQPIGGCVQTAIRNHTCTGTTKYQYKYGFGP